MRSLDIASTGMQAQQTNVDVISNNLANMTTTGFKRRRAEFQDLLYQNERRVGTNTSDSGTVVPAGAQVGLGVRTAAIYRINEQGTLQQTSNSLDVAIQGNGYFPVALPSGETAYTRDGTFGLAPDGTIVTADGYPVAGGIVVPTNATAVTISAAGAVQASIAGQAAPSTVGTLQLAVFPNEAGLDAQGGNLLLQSAASGNPVTGPPGSPGFGSVLQGFVEGSNVNVVTEISNLITAQRAYEMNSKVITTLRPDAVHPDEPTVSAMRWSILAVAITLAAPSHAATLRSSTTLSAREVRLSDLFDGVVSDRAIGPGPDTGGRIVVEAPQLAAIARQFNVDWRPAGSNDRIVLDRPGQAFPREGRPGGLARCLGNRWRFGRCRCRGAGLHPAHGADRR